MSGLDALRGIAALCVLLHHIGIAQETPWPGFDKNYLAVDFFFMLSGYVMARTYEARLGIGLSGLRFFFKRIRRLWPLMALGAVLGLAAKLLAGATTEIIFFIALANILLIPVVGADDAYPVNPPAWSITYELIANAFHAVSWRASLPVLFAVIFSATIVSSAAHLVTGEVNLGSGKWFWFGFPRVFISYTLGIVLWRVWKDNPTLELPPLLTILAMPALMFVGAWIGGWLFDLAFVLLACPLLLAGGLRMNAGASGALVGRMSFPLYATHMPIIWLFRDQGMGWLPGTITALLVAYLISEKPWRRSNALHSEPTPGRGDRAGVDAGL